ncbi:hypothetical protein VTO73DRAFT_1726 [Trametes versicolor]
MDSDSSSSRGPSPTRFRRESPSSDTDSVARSSWKAPASTLHPSASSQAASAPVLRQPVGFGTSPPSVPTYHAPPPEKPAPEQHYLPGQSATEELASKSNKISTKGKDNAASKEKSKASPRKGKEIDKGDTRPPHVPIQRTAFRVRKYLNDPTAVATPYGAQDGPYGSTYRVHMMGEPVPKTKGSQSSKKNAQWQLQTQSVPRRPTPPLSYYYPWQTDPPGGSAPSQAQPGQGSQPRHCKCGFCDVPFLIPSTDRSAGTPSGTSSSTPFNSATSASTSAGTSAGTNTSTSTSTSTSSSTFLSDSLPQFQSTA